MHGYEAATVDSRTPLMYILRCPQSPDSEPRYPHSGSRVPGEVEGHGALRTQGGGGEWQSKRVFHEWLPIAHSPLQAASSSTQAAAEVCGLEEGDCDSRKARGSPCRSSLATRHQPQGLCDTSTLECAFPTDAARKAQPLH